jgi:hypothetical protein
MRRAGGFWKSCVKFVKPDVIPFGPVVNWCVCTHIGTLEEMIIQSCLFFLSSWGKMMTHMILWSVFSIGGDWVVNHIVTLWCVSLSCSLGWVLTFDYPWKNSIMRLICVEFIQYEVVWGRERGLNSMTRSFPTLWLTSSLYILCSFSWYIVRGYIQNFSWEYPCR